MSSGTVMSPHGKCKAPLQRTCLNKGFTELRYIRNLSSRALTRTCMYIPHMHVCMHTHIHTHTESYKKQTMGSMAVSEPSITTQKYIKQFMF